MESIDEKRFWDQLLQLIAEKHVVPVVGRDLLTVRYQDSDVLLYPLIARRLADYLGISGDNLPEGDELNTVACRYIGKGERIEDIYSALKIVMPADEELSIPKPLSKLATIRPFKLFVSTTFDSLLEQAINRERFSGQSRTQILSYTPSTVEDLANHAEQFDHPAVFHLFGRLSATPAYAVTQEDTLEYLHSLQSETRQPKRLFDEMNSASLLILGCNFSDWLARFFIRTPKRLRLLEAHGGTDYVADSRMSNDENLLLFLRHFSTRTKIFKGGSAIQFIDELYNRWTAKYPVDVPIVGEESVIISPANNFRSGAVFLSYANEDKPAAMKIRDALETTGVDVFFDKDALFAGDDFEVKIRRTISECALFIVILSKHTLTGQRRFFRIEWEQAIEESHKVAPTAHFILPVVIDDTQSDQPALPLKFGGLHWEQAPGGEVSSDFVLKVRQLYREYQKNIGVI